MELIWAQIEDKFDFKLLGMSCIVCGSRSRLFIQYTNPRLGEKYLDATEFATTAQLQKEGKQLEVFKLAN